jgi:hypothetical protein
MRTAVVRIGVDPVGVLTPEQLAEGVAALRELAGAADAEVLDNNLTAMPAGRREIEVLLAGIDTEEVTRTALALCAKAFGTEPVAGVVTFVSRGTDDDARGVLAGFGLTGDIERSPGDQGWDIVRVTLRRSDLARIPESRVHTALEASLNCEVHIIVA